MTLKDFTRLLARQVLACPNFGKTELINWFFGPKTGLLHGDYLPDHLYNPHTRKHDIANKRKIYKYMHAGNVERLKQLSETRYIVDTGLKKPFFIDLKHMDKHFHKPANHKKMMEWLEVHGQ